MTAEEVPTLVTVKTVKTRGGSFTLHTDPDALEGYLSCGLMHQRLTPADVTEVLTELGLNEGVVESGVERLVSLAGEGKAADKVLVAKGTPVVEGRSAYLDYEKRPSGQPIAIATSEERVDYREITAFENVREGDHIATLVPMVEGQGGVDIYGRVIPPKKVEDVLIEAGENVRFDPETMKYYATHYGYMVYRNGILSVSPVYRVKGSLDLSHGNIRFIGRVEIGRDVPDEFEVSAERGIEIGGTAEACSLVSGEDIVIRGGVTGKGKGRIECKGNLSTRFLDEVEVYCAGDVEVQKEVINSRVYALGRVIMPGGAILGSEVVALKGILCRDAGSDLGVRTHLIAGLDYHMRERILGINHELVKVQRRQQDMMNRVGPMLAQAIKAPVVDTRRRKEIDELVATSRGMERQIQRLEAESGELSRSFEDEAVNCVTVTRDCYPGVTIVVGKFEYESKGQLTGPLSCFPDEQHHMAAIRQDRMVERLWAALDDADGAGQDDEDESGAAGAEE